MKRFIAILMACLLMAGALPALAEPEAIAVDDGVVLDEVSDLVDEDDLQLSQDIVDLDLSGAIEGPADVDSLDVTPDALTPNDAAEDPEEDEEDPVTELSIKKSSTKKVAVGEDYQIVIPGKTIKKCRSSDKKIATVTNKGLIHTKKAGEVKITITPKKGSKLTLKLKVRRSNAGHYMISHAMGGIDGRNYSNCLEGFLENYKEGHRIFEVDVEITSDDEMVLWHDWDTRFCSKYKAGRTPTYDEFMDSKIFDRYTPMDIESLLLLMDQYPDVRIVTDTKYTKTSIVRRQFKTIVSTAKELGIPDVLDRFVVEIYDKDMFRTVEKIHHFKEYMVTLYKAYKKAPSKSQLQSVAKFCKKNGIATIAMYAKWWKPKYANYVEPYGLDLALYTVNSSHDADDYFDEGVTALFTDFLPPV